MTIGGGFSFVTMAGGAQPTVKMANPMTIGEDDGGGGVGWGGNNIGECLR